MLYSYVVLSCTCELNERVTIYSRDRVHVMHALHFVSGSSVQHACLTWSLCAVSSVTGTDCIQFVRTVK